MALSVTVEPLEGGSVAFLSLAPGTNAGTAQGLLCLRVRISNSGPSAVHIDTVTQTFTPSSVGPFVDAFGVDIPVGSWAEWTTPTDQDVLLPSPAPSSIKIAVAGTGFASPFEVTFPLVAYTVPNGGYRFPTDAKSLKSGEFWYGSTGNHGTGASGSQLFAHDLGVIAIDPATNAWSGTKSGTTADANEDFLIWGKPVCAVADGIVRERIDGVPSNPHPLKWVDEADLNAQLAEQMNLYWGSFTNGGAGNHFYIQHDDAIVLYAHMQPGTLNAALLDGMPVKAGDVLGFAGNSGNSTAPHLHVHAIQGTSPEVGPLRPMPFKDTMAIDLGALTTPFQKAPWSKLVGQGPPYVASAIYPAGNFPPSLRKPIYEAAIDPLALVLSERIYVLLTLPDPPPPIIRQLVEAARALTPGQRKTALARLNAFRDGYLSVVQRALVESGGAAPIRPGVQDAKKG